MNQARRPQFGEHVPHVNARCTPSELFRCLLNVEDNVHYLEAAFLFAEAAIARAAVPPLETGSSNSWLAALKGSVDFDLAAAQGVSHATAWPVRIAKEFAPVGLTDGCWLHGVVRANVVESEVGALCLRQLMLRFGDPGSRESYTSRYEWLLHSIGVTSASIGRYESENAAACVPISYEHALLGLTLGLFPVTFTGETLGFNLWMTEFGPCPLLVRLLDELQQRGACLRYFIEQDAAILQQLATDAVLQYVRDVGGDAMAEVASGFHAAHRSYQRWQAGMLGRNVPMSPRGFVLEAINRKAPFARGHHGNIRLGEAPIEQLLAGGTQGHETLLDDLARSEWVCAGSPDESAFVTRLLSIGGPMFEIFTPSEQRDIREWIASLGTHPNEQVTAPVALQGRYECPQEPDGLRQHALTAFGSRPSHEQLYYCANADRYPAVRLFAKVLTAAFLARLQRAFEADPCLAGQGPPPWSEAAVVELVVRRHAQNVESRGRPKSEERQATRPSVIIAFDGAWLQGFIDVWRSGREEYGWLFRIYASEQGDGTLTSNHNYIARQAVTELGEEVKLPATDRRFYEFCTVSAMNVLMIAASLNTQYFMPELLGANLGVEATGVCGSYIDSWKERVSLRMNDWAVLSYRLHNSIDNYAAGHTKWSVAAIQAFMTDVCASAPQAREEQWARIWRLWRLQEIIEHGTESEQRALRTAIGFNVSSLAPTPASWTASTEAS